MDPTTPSTINAVTLPGSTGPIDMSIVGMFVHADIIVKVVVLVLLLASFWSWAIIFDKTIRLRSLRTKAAQFEETFWSGISLEDLYDRIGARPDDPMSSVFAGAMREWRRTVSKGIALTGAARASLQQRMEQVMGVTVSRETDALEKRMTFLASVGSTATFIGLFGTVWGIMNSFQSIALSKNTSLAVVAPGIAEALFATALGLVAAVPAVVAYNKLSNEIARYAQRLEGFAAEFLTILSRQLEEAR